MSCKNHAFRDLFDIYGPQAVSFVCLKSIVNNAPTTIQQPLPTHQLPLCIHGNAGIPLADMLKLNAPAVYGAVNDDVVELLGFCNVKIVDNNEILQISYL